MDAKHYGAARRFAATHRWVIVRARDAAKVGRFRRRDEAVRAAKRRGQVVEIDEIEKRVVFEEASDANA